MANGCCVHVGRDLSGGVRVSVSVGDLCVFACARACVVLLETWNLSLFTFVILSCLVGGKMVTPNENTIN